MWKMVFYTGYFTNSLVPGVEIKGHWEPIISRKEFKLLQSRLSNSNQIGIPKINGKTSTPLVPKFLICAECDNTMTSYLNKAKRIYYYKCGKCNKTANANTRPKSINDGLNQQFRKSVDSLQFSKSFHKLFSKQLEKIIDTEMSGTSEKKWILKTEVNDLQQTYDDMEYRFAIGKISQEIFDKHAPKLKTQIDEKSKQLLNLPSKKSNHQKFLKKFLKIAENPGKFYESLNYNDKRVFQNIVFPEGFMFSLKNKECRTSKMNVIFDLTNSFKHTYSPKTKETQIQKVLESRLVAGLELAPSTTYVISGPNAFNRSSLPILVGGNTSINRVFTIATLLSDYLGTLNFRYEEPELNGIPEADLVLEIEDTNEIWNNVTPIIDQTNNSLSYNFTELIGFKSVTSSSVNNTLTVEPTKRDSFIKVYPNPTTDFIFIDSDLSYQSTIYNIIGQRVLKSNSKQLNVSNLPIGTYLLYLKSETNTTLTFKIIKK